jgi:hypothetical protein
MSDISHENQLNSIKFLPVSQDWPNGLSIMGHKYKFIGTDDLVRYLKTLIRFQFIKTGDENRLYRRTIVIKIVESIKFNINICYGEPYINSLVDTLVTKMNEVDELAEYTEDFKRKCLKSYREQSRKRLINFYFKRIQGLCPDVIELIINFI